MTEQVQRSGKPVAIITGIAAGFGQELCLSLSNAGYSIVGMARSRRAEGESACLSPQAIADTYLHLNSQNKSAWTQEIDIRPFLESF